GVLQYTEDGSRGAGGAGEVGADRIEGALPSGVFEPCGRHHHLPQPDRGATGGDRGYPVATAGEAVDAAKPAAGGGQISANADRKGRLRSAVRGAAVEADAAGAIAGSAGAEAAGRRIQTRGRGEGYCERRGIGVSAEEGKFEGGGEVMG